jgi:predicted GNAT family acetyltransferase
MTRHEQISLADTRRSAPARGTGPVNDPLEHEADQASRAIASNHSVGVTGKAEASSIESPRATDALARGGVPLNAEQRAYFEPRFGHDFSDVRLHTHDQARQAAQGIGARAFTYGRDIAFAKSGHDTGLLAHELTHVVQQRGGNPTIQRQPDDKGEIQMPMEWAFAYDPKRATDIRYARSLGKSDAKRLRKAGTLSADDRAEVNAKLQFFNGDAFDAYVAEVRLVLTEVTREEIDMGEEEKKVPVGDSSKTRLEFLRGLPTYIDNDIARIEYFTAELAIIHYKDGTKFELGLTAQWMKPPVVEVDYTTPRHLLHAVVSTKNETRFFREGGNTPRTASFDEIMTKYSSEVRFYVENGTGRVVPSHINMLTAPTLCGVLQNSLARYEEQVDMAVAIGLGGTVAIGGYAGAGGLPTNTGVALGRTVVAKGLSSTARSLAREMDTLLASGAEKTLTAEGVQLARVAVSRQGNTLVVSRFMSKLPDALRGQGTGMRVTAAFEDAAVEVARLNGAKTVTIDVGIIINPGWRQLLEARGYIHVMEQGAWIKTINL